ncbi:hypothetical protein Mame01_28590 [Microbispora amethystogenes]|nr:hypothetical protein Mame01_28590 [Microbispora amethystogenes]
MTAPQDAATNVAADTSQVGVQGIVHGDVHYYAVAPDAPAEKRFEVGARFLDGGAAGRALELIDEALALGYVTNKVWFHWLLALVSGRTRQELSAWEAARLRYLDRSLTITGDDSWADGVRVVRRLLDAAGKSDADIRVLMKELDELRPTQRGMILRHMEVFLDGPLKDQMWRLVLQRACDDQLSDGRKDRVWKFFQPEPVPPRVRQPAPVAVPGATWVRAVAGTIVSVAATGHIGLLLAQNGQVPALLACVLGVAGACVAGRAGLEWRFRSGRRRAIDEAYAPGPPRRTSLPPDRLAKRVDHQFTYYLGKYVPYGMDRETWLTWTAGIRRRMRDEVADAYRDTGDKVEEFNWLIRHRAGRLKCQWERGTLWNYRRELATPPRTMAAAVFGTLAFATGGVWVAGEAVRAGGLVGIRSIALVVVAGWVAGRSWMLIALAHRHHAADQAETEKLEKDSEEAFARWKDRLRDKPDDGEMAIWLDCDRKVLLEQALRHYQLKMSDVVAHAFIEARSGSATRARVPGGPWRYRRYQLMIFLLTADGVRQWNAVLDFPEGTFDEPQRLNYRYEAVTTVRVRQEKSKARTFELSLMDGQKITAQMIGPEMEEPQQAEDSEAVSEVTLDAAGLRHTLHVLEGVAAEGKAWMTLDRRRGDTRRENRDHPPDGRPAP